MKKYVHNCTSSFASFYLAQGLLNDELCRWTTPWANFSLIARRLLLPLVTLSNSFDRRPLHRQRRRRRRSIHPISSSTPAWNQLPSTSVDSTCWDRFSESLTLMLYCSSLNVCNKIIVTDTSRSAASSATTFAPCADCTFSNKRNTGISVYNKPRLFA